MTAHTYAHYRALAIAAEAAPGTTERRAALLTAMALDCTRKWTTTAAQIGAADAGEEVRAGAMAVLKRILVEMPAMPDLEIVIAAHAVTALAPRFDLADMPRLRKPRRRRGSPASTAPVADLAAYRDNRHRLANSRPPRS